MNTPILESWKVQGFHTYQADVSLTAGFHVVRVEFAQGPPFDFGLIVEWGSSTFREKIGPYSGIMSTPTATPTATATSTLTPTPTFTPTPASTPTPTPEPWWQWSAAEEAALQDEPQTVREDYSNLLSRVRDEVMRPDPKGEVYIRLIYRHAPEITALLLTDPALRQETRTLMLEVGPLLEELLDRKTDGVRLSADWVKRTLVLLGNVEKKSSPALKVEIRWWRAWLPRFVGKTGQEIWKMLPPRHAGQLPRIEGSPEELVLQSLSAEDARAFGRLLSQVRDEIMYAEKGGEVYAALVYRYTPEVVGFLLNDETLRKEAEALLLEAQPGLEFWLGQREETWRFSDDWVNRAGALLAKLAEKGSPELHAEAIWWQERVRNWAGKTPQDVWGSLLSEPRVQSGK